MNTTQNNNSHRSAADLVDEILAEMEDVTVETKLSECDQFLAYQRKLEADRAAVAARFAEKRTETERFLRVARSL